MNDIEIRPFLVIEDMFGQYVIEKNEHVKFYPHSGRAVILDENYVKRHVQKLDDMLMCRAVIVKTPIQRTIYKKVIKSKGRFKTDVDMFITRLPPVFLDPQADLEELPMIEEVKTILNI